MNTTKFSDPSGGDDLGGNAWFTSNAMWQHWLDRKNVTISLLRYSLGLDPLNWQPRGSSGTGNVSSLAPAALLDRSRINETSSLAGVVLYVPAFIADAAVYGTSPLSRVSELILDLWHAGLEVVLLLGRPEFQGAGASWADTHDVVHSAAAREQLKGYVRAFLQLPGVQTAVSFVSVYWMGASGYCTGAGAFSCSADDIAGYESDLATLVKSFPRSTPVAINQTAFSNETATISVASSIVSEASSFLYLHHVDGLLWERHWVASAEVKANGSWNYGGYGPLSLKRNLTRGDGILAEAWTQGSLVNAVSSFASFGDWSVPSSSVAWPASSSAFNGTNFLFLYSVANWASNPAGDISTWFGWLANNLGIHHTWSTWAWLDCGVAELTAQGMSQGCPYSNVMPNASTIVGSGAFPGGATTWQIDFAFQAAMSSKGALFRQRCLLDGVVA